MTITCEETFSTLLDANSVWGRSPAIEDVRVMVTCASGVDAAVMISGEPGVGQQLLAQRLHESSGRAAQPFAIVRCGGVPDAVLTSRLFGHVRGSVPGAHADRKGVFEEADGGTVFLDEIGDASPGVQERLFEFLESGEVHRIGAYGPPSRADVRILTGTSRDLRDDIAAGSFREDLFFRLNVLHIVLPPLRTRREEVPTLFEECLHRFASRHGLLTPAVSDAARAQLVHYDWPGNLRQLTHIAEHLALRDRALPITVEDLPHEITGRRAN